MQLNHLLYFSEVVHEGSISRAAKKLHISQPSLSTTIKNLEQELEQPLLKRTKHGVLPTEFGMRVFEDFAAFKEKMDKWYPSHDISEKTLNGTIHLNVMPSASEYFYKNLIFPFTELHPEVSFCLSNAFLQTIFSELENSESNIAVLSIQKTLEQKLLDKVKQHGWHCQHIFTDKRILAISSSHPLAKKQSLTTNDLKQLSIVYYSQKNDTISSMYEKYFKAPYRVGSYNDVLMFILHGKAIFLPLQHLSDLKHYEDRGQMRFYSIPVDDISDEIPIYVIYTDHLDDNEQVFLQYLINYFQHISK